MRKDVLTSLLAVAVLTLLLGLAYPLAVTGVSQLTMRDRANGSLVERDGRTVGSRLIAQDFRRPALDAAGRPQRDADGEPVLVADERYFQPRPSATGYAADATAFSNLGPNGIDTRDAIRGRIDAYLALERRYRPTLAAAQVPVDAATSSGSSVDPQISVANARIQSHRIAAVRGLPLDRVNGLVDDHTRGRTLGVLGEPRVDVLALNLALDGLSSPKDLSQNDRPPVAAADTSPDRHPNPQSDNQSDSRASSGDLLGHRPPRSTTDSETGPKTGAAR